MFNVNMALATPVLRSHRQSLQVPVSKVFVSLRDDVHNVYVCVGVSVCVPLNLASSFAFSPRLPATSFTLAWY